MFKRLLLSAFLLFTLQLQAQVTVKTRLDTANILIGEQVQLQLKCTAQARQKVEFPQFQPNAPLTPGIEVVSNDGIDTLLMNNGRQMELTRRYTITSFDSALYTLPPMQVKVDGKTYSSLNSLGLKVSTVPVDTIHIDQFNPPHGVVNIPFEWSWRLISAVLLIWVLLVAALILIVRYSDPRLITRKVVIHPPVPAHVTAIQKIETIKAAPKEDTKLYYMQLTDTLRDYIERRFGFNAKEMTTGEIIDELCTTDQAETLDELKSVLLTADLVKFAQYTASLSEQDRNLIQALEFVDTTKIEPAEQPKPKVEYVTLSGKNQFKLRTAMLAGILVLTLSAIGLSIYTGYNIYQCFA